MVKPFQDANFEFINSRARLERHTRCLDTMRGNRRVTSSDARRGVVHFQVQYFPFDS